MPVLFDNLFKDKLGVVNVRMVITEEKILSNIEKIQKMINPNSKKQIVQLEEDTYFKDLVESIRTYLVEYPKKKNFPKSVYKAAYDLVEYATNQFEENTKKIEELIVQREKNIGLAFELKVILSKVVNKEEGYETVIEEASEKYNEDIIEALKLIATGDKDEKATAKKLVEARVSNLESNFHIEIDMERVEDRSKALSFIGVQIAEALKDIPAPSNEFVKASIEEAPVAKPKKIQKVKKVKEQPVVEQTAPAIQNYENEVYDNNQVEEAIPQVNEEPQDEILSDAYMQQTRVNVKPSLWQRIINSKFIRTMRYIMKIKVVLELPALPEGRGDNN